MRYSNIKKSVIEQFKAPQGHKIVPFILGAPGGGKSACAREIMAEVTLIARDEMGFRMLIGRQALKREWIVDPSRSFMAADDVMFVRQAAVRSRTDEEE